MFEFERIIWLFITAAITGIIGYFLGDFRALIKNVKSEKQEKNTRNELTNTALRYLLKGEITEMCDKYLTLGYLPQRKSELIIEMRDIYHDLGGNSYISKLTEDVLKLPHRCKYNEN